MTFAIKRVRAGEMQYFVGEDEVLWDWLHADNIKYVGFQMSRAVDAPEGYVFNSARAMVKHLPSYGEVKELLGLPAFTRMQYLPSSITLVSAKALMLVSEYANVLTPCSAEDFEALEVDESRVYNFPVITLTPEQEELRKQMHQIRRQRKEEKR